MYKTTEGYEIEILKYNGWYDSTIRLSDGTILECVILSSIRSGQIKNPNHKTKYGVGYFGQGEFKSVGDDLKKYLVWVAMLQRCYDKNYQEKQPTYKGCSVVEEWHNFQNFAKWFEENYNHEYMEDWALDKDILIKENKIYSPDTCAFVPRDINIFFQKRKKESELPCGIREKINRYQVVLTNQNGRTNFGSYKTLNEAINVAKIEKEKYAKYLADKYKNQITDKVYQALYNYQVEITD